ncbi:pilus assembly protein [Dyella telluris]|nr:pilus assembly protein PilY [Dyella telluris]
MRLNRHLLRFMPVALLAAAAGVLSPSAVAEDIDIYAPALNQQPGGAPNVVISLDTSDAWNGGVSFTCPLVNGVNPNATNKKAASVSGFVQCALYQAVYSLGQNPSLAGNIDIGMMRYNIAPNDGLANTGAKFSGSGGSFKFPSTIGSKNTQGPAPQPLPVIGGATGSAGATNLTNLLGTIQGLDSTADGANNQNAGTAFQEVWAYYAAKVGLSNENYSSLTNSNYCRRNYQIFVAGAFTNTKAGANVDWATPLQAAGATTAQQQIVTIPPPYNKYQGQGGDPEWARFMYQTDLSNGLDPSGIENIITYTIVVTDGSNPDLVQYLTTTAANGGGKAFVVNVNDVSAVNELVTAFSTIFNEVEAVNSVFSSVSLPLSANNEGTYNNQFFYGMFRPESSFLPRWWGNLKQYQAGYVSGTLVLTDANGQSAVNSTTGFITPGAVSFWTTTTNKVGTAQWPATGYWYNTYLTKNKNFGSGATTDAFDSPDGSLVEKGAAAEVLRGVNLASDVRTVYTCANSGGGCTANMGPDLFATTNSTLAASATFTTSTSTVPTTTTLINWVRGQDLAGNETEPGPYGLNPMTAPSPALPIGATSTARPSIHGDVLHSQPAVINYGGNVVVFYGSNDGMFHAVNGNQTGNITSGTTTVPPGGELWSFVAPEFFPKLVRLYNNSPVAKFGANPPTGSIAKDYFMDGSPATFQDNRPASTTYGKKYIYLTPRRGGSFIYAFDVTDPVNPTFLWEKTLATLPELGQAWSRPVVAMAAGLKISGTATDHPVLVMGGGYDPAEDIDPYVGPDTHGRSIFVLDAVTGDTVWVAQPSCANAPTNASGRAVTCVAVSGMQYAIPSQLTLLDRNGDGYIDRIYAPDQGGNIWRVDLPTSGVSAWSVSKLASLGGTGNNARKFFYPVDVVTTSSYDVVTASSGDREHPLYSAATGSATQVQNAFFSIYDPNVGTSVPSGWTPITENNLTLTFTSGSAPVAYNQSTAKSTSGGVSQGFFVNYQPGEKGVNAPTIVAGYAYFGTNTPTNPSSAPVCTANLGIARGYAINVFTGLGMNGNGFVTFGGGGMPPTPVFGFVQIGSGVVAVLTGGGNQQGSGGGAAGASSDIDVTQVSPPALHTRKRTYWYKEGVK